MECISDFLLRIESRYVLLKTKLGTVYATALLCFVCAIGSANAQTTTLFATIFDSQSRIALVEYSLNGVLLRTITNPALGGTNALNGRYGLGVSPDGVIFVADQNANLVSTKIKRYSVATGAYLGGFAIAGVSLNSVENIQFDSAGNIIVVDSNKIIIANRTTGEAIRTIQDFRLDSARSVAVRPGNGNLLVANANGGSIFEFNAATGNYVGQFNTQGLGSALTGFVLGADNNFYGASGGTGVISRLGASGGVPTQFVVPGQPQYLATVGDSLYAARNNNDGGIVRYSLTTGLETGRVAGISAIGITAYTVGAVAVPEMPTPGLLTLALGMVAGATVSRRRK